MNQISYDEPLQYGSSVCAEPMMKAERELSAFFSAVAELFGPEQAALAATDWLQQLEVVTDLPASSRDWRLMSIEASCGSQTESPPKLYAEKMNVMRDYSAPPYWRIVVAVVFG